jgi:hypothetical protein
VESEPCNGGLTNLDRLRPHLTDPTAQRLLALVQEARGQSAMEQILEAAAAQRLAELTEGLADAEARMA